MSTAVRLALAALLLLAVGGAAYLWLSEAPVEETVELAEQGAEKRLREPMRPVLGGARVLLVALDGVGDDDLRGALRRGEMPHLAAVLGEPRSDDLFASGYAAPGVLSILPSTTMAAWSSVYTGEPPARTGVPGNEWYEREADRFVAPAPVSVAEFEHTLRIYTDGLLGAAVRVPTLFERIRGRSHVSLAPVHRGADLLTVPDAGALAELFGAVAEGVVEGEAVEQEAYQEVDENGVEQLLASMEAHGTPDLQVAYFPGVDLFTHVADDPVTAQQRYLGEVVDVQLGRVLDHYRRRGLLDSTYLVIVSDHGHTPVLSDDRHALGTTGGGEPPDLLEAAGFRPRPFHLELEPSQRDHQAVVAYQGAMAYVYLADRSGCIEPGSRCDWNRPPRLEEDVLPVARAFWEASRTGAGVPELRGTLDLVLAREPVPTSEEARPFQVFDGERLVPVREYLARNPRPELLRLAERLEALAVGPYGHRAGDVLLLSRFGAHLPLEQRFYFSGEYHSWHGSPTPQDSRIPLVVARRGTDGREIREAVRRAAGDAPDQLDVAALVRALLEG